MLGSIAPQVAFLVDWDTSLIADNPLPQAPETDIGGLLAEALADYLHLLDERADLEDEGEQTDAEAHSKI